MSDMTVVNTIISTVAAIISAFITYKKSIVPMKKNSLYYKNVLLSFVEEYHKHSNRNWRRYLINNLNRKDEFVPPYIFYLIDNEYNNEDIKKVLANDYRVLYDNGSNFVFQITDNIIIFLDIVGYFLFLVSLSISVVFEFLVLGDFVIQLARHNYRSVAIDIKSFIVLGVVIIVLFVMIRYLSVTLDGDYSLKKKSIQRKIKYKLDDYEKCKDNYYM